MSILTKREEFIKAAMQGLITGDIEDRLTSHRVAVLAVEIADEVIEEAKQNPQ